MRGQEGFWKSVKKVSVKTVHRAPQVLLLVDYRVGTFSFKAHLAAVINQKTDCLFPSDRLQDKLSYE